MEILCSFLNIPHTLSQAHQFHSSQLFWVNQPVNVVFAQLCLFLSISFAIVLNSKKSVSVTTENVCHCRCSHVKGNCQVFNCPSNSILTALAAVVKVYDASGYIHI